MLYAAALRQCTPMSNDSTHTSPMTANTEKGTITNTTNDKNSR
jgi:hypothetical protein